MIKKEKVSSEGKIRKSKEEVRVYILNSVIARKEMVLSKVKCR